MQKLYYLLLTFFLLMPISLLASGGGNTTPVNLVNPLPATKDIPELIGQVINASMGLVGSLALLMFIYGGFTWMLAAGNNEKVQKGKNIMIWAIAGLVVIFSSYAIITFIFKAIGVAKD